jgi:hypothetical protein
MYLKRGLWGKRWEYRFKGIVGIMKIIIVGVAKLKSN